MLYNLIKHTGIAVAILILMGILYLSCNKKTATTTGTTNAMSGKKVLALGDSYSIGESVNEEERFINKTITLLKSNDINVNYPAQIIAKTGWTTKNLLDAIAANENNLNLPYDAVTLLIGVNNQYQHLDTSNYRSEFRLCLQKALMLSGNKRERVFVLSIPDYGATAFGAGNANQIGLDIDQFNNINKQITLEMGISYTDITTSTRMATTDVTLVASDGLHPSGKEYLKWANLIAPKISAVLQK